LREPGWEIRRIPGPTTGVRAVRSGHALYNDACVPSVSNNIAAVTAYNGAHPDEDEKFKGVHLGYRAVDRYRRGHLVDRSLD
jgi:hypothetical protein